MLLAYGASSSMRGRMGLFMFTAYPISRMTLIEELEFSELMKITAFETSMASTMFLLIGAAVDFLFVNPILNAVLL